MRVGSLEVVEVVEEGPRRSAEGKPLALAFEWYLTVPAPTRGITIELLGVWSAPRAPPTMPTPSPSLGEVVEERLRRLVEQKSEKSCHDSGGGASTVVEGASHWYISIRRSKGLIVMEFPWQNLPRESSREPPRTS